MSEPLPVGLDNPVFNGRLRIPRNTSAPKIESRPPIFDQQVPAEAARTVDSLVPVWMRPLTKSENQAEPETTSERYKELNLKIEETESFTRKTNDALVVKRRLSQRLFGQTKFHFHPQSYTKVQKALFVMAICIFLMGVAVCIQTLTVNQHATKQVEAISKKANKNHTVAVPSSKPANDPLKNYVVPPDMPRYIKIPKLSVYSRVLKVGLTKAGAVDTPNNVADAAWYSGSAKPGAPGAMLIDGHVSSWTTHGAFYGLKNLAAGDIIQIVRGDGQIFNYKVVKTQKYADNQVDMNAAVAPVTAGKPGLNLITCTGRVKPGTSEFNQRLVVFTEQI